MHHHSVTKFQRFSIGCHQALALKSLTSLLIFCMLILGLLGFHSELLSADELQKPKHSRGLSREEIRNQVRNALDGLNSNQLARRQQAEADLLALGPQALGELPPQDLVTSATARNALSRIRMRLELQKAELSVQPSRVTIVTNQALQQVIQAITSQTNNQLDISSIPAHILDQKVSTRFTNETFWTTLDRICLDQKLQYRFLASSPRLTLVERKQGTSEWGVVTNGAFRISLNKIQTRAVSLQNKTRLLQADLAIAPEPRLRALFLKLAARDFRAETKDGIMVSPTDPDAQYDFPLGEGGRFVPFTIGLSCSSQFEDTDLYPMRIHGKALVEIAAEEERFAFSRLETSSGIARRRGGVTVTLQKVEAKPSESGNLWLTVRMMVAYERGDGPAFESHRTWVLHNQVTMERDGVEPINADGGFSTEYQGNGRVVLTYRFDLGNTTLDGWQFVYVAPTLIIDVPIEFAWDSIRPPG